MHNLFLRRLLPECSICQARLSVRTYWSQRWAGSLTYPARMQDGSRAETHVDWLCGSCCRRAERRREGKDPEHYLPRPPQSGTGQH